MLHKNRWNRGIAFTIIALALSITASAFARDWKGVDFDNRPLFDYPLPSGSDSLIGSPTSYKIEKGETLLDIGRWYGLSGKEISDANGRIDWWAPPAQQVLLPTEHILPEGPRSGIVLNIPEMRIYYYYPSAVAARHHRGRLKAAALSGGRPRVVYTFPVGLGRYDWKTPVGAWTVIAKIKNPTWVVPQDIYEEHLERDGEAQHVYPGGDPDNPLGLYKLALSIPEYGIHGTDVEWGIGMNVSHGCIRLYPEDIERLFMKTPVGTPGRFVYQPVKFGWRGDALYVEVHDDLYAVYPGLWNHALNEVKRLKLDDDVDLTKLQKAVETRSGIPTYVMTGPEPGAPTESASIPPPPAPIVAARSSSATRIVMPTATTEAPATGTAANEAPLPLAPTVIHRDSESLKDDWQSVPARGPNDNTVE
jgi:L,D-transpeptidase ErfK/SrfK